MQYAGKVLGESFLASLHQPKPWSLLHWNGSGKHHLFLHEAWQNIQVGAHGNLMHFQGTISLMYFQVIFHYETAENHVPRHWLVVLGSFFGFHSIIFGFLTSIVSRSQLNNEVGSFSLVSLFLCHFTINQQFPSNFFTFDAVIDTILKSFNVYLFNWDISLPTVIWKKKIINLSAQYIWCFFGTLLLCEGKTRQNNHQPFQLTFQGVAEQCCMDHIRLPKGQRNLFNVSIVNNEIDITVVFHLNVMYFHVYACAGWILRKIVHTKAS